MGEVWLCSEEWRMVESISAADPYTHWSQVRCVECGTTHVKGFWRADLCRFGLMLESTSRDGQWVHVGQGEEVVREEYPVTGSQCVYS